MQPVMNEKRKRSLAATRRRHFVYWVLHKQQKEQKKEEEKSKPPQPAEALSCARCPSGSETVKGGKTINNLVVKDINMHVLAASLRPSTASSPRIQRLQGCSLPAPPKKARC